VPTAEKLLQLRRINQLIRSTESINVDIQLATSQVAQGVAFLQISSTGRGIKSQLALRLPDFASFQAPPLHKLGYAYANSISITLQVFNESATQSESEISPAVNLTYDLDSYINGSAFFETTNPLLRPYLETDEDTILRDYLENMTYVKKDYIMDSKKRTPLHWAAFGNKLKLAKFWLSYALNPNSSDDFNVRPLHLAALGNYSAMVTLLLNNGANKDVVDCNNMTPLDVATKYNARDCVTIITEAPVVRHNSNYIWKESQLIGDDVSFVDDGRTNLHSSMMELTELITSQTSSENLVGTSFYTLFRHRSKLSPKFDEVFRKTHQYGIYPSNILRASPKQNFAVLEEIIRDINQMVQAPPSSHRHTETIISAFKALANEYQKYIVNAKEMKVSFKDLAESTECIIHGIDQIGHRNVSKQLQQKIMSLFNLTTGQPRRHENQRFGSHAVINNGEIHYKFTQLKISQPERGIFVGFPGIEYAVEALNKLIFGFGSPATTILRLELGKFSYFVQASRSVDGKVLREALYENKYLRIEEENYSAMFVLGLLTNPHDNKGDNIIFKPDSTVEGIDNDLDFARSVFPSSKYPGKSVIGVKNFLTWMKQAEEPVHHNVRKHILEIDPEAILVEWLYLLHLQNMRYQQLLRDHVFTEQEYHRDLHLPIQLEPGMIFTLCKKLNRIKHLMKVDGVTHNQLLNDIEPLVYLYNSKFKNNMLEPLQMENEVYQHATRQDKTFEALFSPEELSQSINVQGEDRLITDLIQEAMANTLKAEDWLDDHTMFNQPISQVAADFVGSIDFAMISSAAQRKIFNILHFLPMAHITICNSREFGDDDLKHVVNISMQNSILQSVELQSCPRVSIVGILELTRASPTLSLTLCDNPQITPSLVNKIPSTFCKHLNWWPTKEHKDVIKKFNSLDPDLFREQAAEVLSALPVIESFLPVKNVLTMDDVAEAFYRVANLKMYQKQFDWAAAYFSASLKMHKDAELCNQKALEIMAIYRAAGVLEAQKIRQLVDCLLEPSKLDLSGSVISDRDLQMILQLYPSVTHLSLAMCHELTDGSLLYLSHQCTKLKQLSIRRSPSFTNIGIATLVNCKELEVLWLNGIQGHPSNVSDECISNIALSCPKLWFLYLHNCLEITDKTLEVLSSKALNLRVLVLNQCTKITEKGLKCLLKLQRLEKIYVEGLQVPSSLASGFFKRKVTVIVEASMDLNGKNWL
jgi:hypothetical protein